MLIILTFCASKCFFFLLQGFNAVIYMKSMTVLVQWWLSMKWGDKEGRTDEQTDDAITIEDQTFEVASAIDFEGRIVRVRFTWKKFCSDKLWRA